MSTTMSTSIPMSATFAQLWSSLCANYQRNERDLNYAYGGAQNVRFFTQLYTMSDVAQVPVREVVLTNVRLDGTDSRDHLTNEAKRSKTFYAVLVLVAQSPDCSQHWIRESIFFKSMFHDTPDVLSIFSLQVDRDREPQLPTTCDDELFIDDRLAEFDLTEDAADSSDEEEEDEAETEQEMHDNFRRIPKPFQRPQNTAPLKWLTEVYHSFYNNFFQDIRRLKVSHRIVNPRRPELLYC